MMRLPATARSAGAAAAAALFAGALASVSAGSARAGTATGGAYVTTLPSGADVWLDGTYVGRAPVLVDALLSGHHALTLTKSGWVVQEVDIDVPAGGVALSSTRLVAGPKALAGAAMGSAVVRSAPNNAVVEIDGLPIDRSNKNPMPLTAGPHHVTLTTGKGKSTSTFFVLPDTSTGLVLAEPAAKAQRSAVVAPAEDYLADGTFSIEGKKVVIRSGGHLAIAHFGETAARLDGTMLDLGVAPETIGGKLYLPLELLEKLTAETSKGN